MHPRLRCLLAIAALSAPATACAQEPEATAGDQSAETSATLTDEDRDAALIAAGFKFEDGAWRACGDPGTASYVPGQVDSVTDLDGDGRPEAVISEGSTYCFGGTEVGYYLTSRQEDGSWKLIDSGYGIPIFLEVKGEGGWPDLMVGGPGFCFPVLRWDGAQYVQSRFEYEGKACIP